MNSAKVDAIVLDFHDSLIRESDFTLLDAPNWLNDTMVGLAFECFERRQFADVSSQVCFVGPSVTQCLKFATGTELGVFLDPLQLQDKQYALFALNDSGSAEEAGGSHWSLLVYDQCSQDFQHYDSCCGSNTGEARSVAKELAAYLHVPPPVKFTDMECPQQTNSCDCGVYCIAIAEVLCARRFRGEDMPLSTSITPDSIKAKRSRLKELIIQLKNELV